MSHAIAYAPASFRLIASEDDISEPVVAPRNPDEPHPEMTLAEFYENYVEKHVIIHAKKSTKAEYRRSLKFWRKLVGQPQLCEITRNSCSTFVSGLAATVVKKGTTMCDETVHKHCRNIQMILDRTGPIQERGLYGRLNAEILDRVPVLLKPTLLGSEVEDCFTMQELETLLQSCHAAITPNCEKVPNAEWWQALFIVIYNTCLRIGSVRNIHYDKIVKDQYGYWVTLRRTENKKKAQLVYLNAHAMEAINRIRTNRKVVFDWPHVESWLHAQRRRICALHLPESRQFGFHAIRKLAMNELGEINSLAVKMAANHSERDVTKDHYMHRSTLSRASDKLPQPAWQWADLSQKLLF
ncbi:MAG: hypothetical protein ACO1RA_02490 [Planctomycetaceae bacterium]